MSTSLSADARRIFEQWEQALAAGDHLRPAPTAATASASDDGAAVLECCRDHAWPPFAPLDRPPHGLGCVGHVEMADAERDSAHRSRRC
jgi:hypothetical protein